MERLIYLGSRLSKKPGAVWRTEAVLLGAAVSLISFVLYLLTLAPTVLPYDLPELPDTAMLQMQACVLGISHPTGYPGYLMLTHLFTYLPFGDCAYAVNLASAVYAALAVAVLYAVAFLLTRRALAAAVGSLAFGLSMAFWSQAVIAEVYTLNALLVSLVILIVLLWRERRRDGYLLLAAFLCGLSLTNHMTSGLLIPAALLFVGLVEWRKLVDWRLGLKGAGLFLLGLVPYLYLPIRASMDPPFEGNNPDTLERFWYVVSGGNLTGTFFTFGPAELPARMAFYGGRLLDNFHWALLEVALLGFIALVLWDRAGAALLAFLYAGWTFHAVENNIVDVNLYFIPTYLVVALLISAGVSFALEEATNITTARFPRAPGWLVSGTLAALLLALSLLGVWDTYAQNDRSEDYRARDNIEAVAENVPQGATVLHHRSELWYMVLVEERRRDLTLVDPFVHNGNVLYTHIVWPDYTDLPTANRRYGTDDRSGVSAANIAAEKGPVYILAEEYANPYNFIQKGFRAVHVEDAVYELIPPEKTPKGTSS